jgi:hypothetical protein
MTAEQRDKAVAWFRRLPSNVPGLTLTLSFFVTAANIFLILIFLFYLQLLCCNNQEWKPFRLPVSYQQQAIITQKMTLLALYIYINFLGHKCIGQITMVSFQERNWMLENQLVSKQRRPMHCHAWLHSKMTMKISPPQMPVAYVYDSITRTAVKKIHMSQVRTRGLILPLILMTLNLQIYRKEVW